MRNFYQKRNRELIIPLSVCSKDTSPVNFGLAGVFVRPSLWLLYIRQSNQYILPLCPVAFSFLQILGQKHIPYKSLMIFALFPYDIFYNSKPLNLFFFCYAFFHFLHSSIFNHMTFTTKPFPIFKISIIYSFVC